MNNLKTQLFTLRDEDMRDFSFIVTKRKILFEERIDKYLLKKYKNLFKDKKAL